MVLPIVLAYEQRAAVETRSETRTNPRVVIRESGVTPRCVSDTRRIGSRTRKAGGLIPPRRNLNTILNRHRLVRWITRILHQLRREFPLATAAREVGVAHGSAVPRWASRPAVGLRPSVNQILNQRCAPGLPRSGSPQNSTLCPPYVQRPVGRQIWGLHNKERAREINPLTSANRRPRVSRSVSDKNTRNHTKNSYFVRQSDTGPVGVLNASH